MKSKFVSSILNYPKSYIFLVFIVSMFSAPYLLEMKAVYSSRIWFSDNHEITQNLNDYEEMFGNSNTLVVGVSFSDDVLSASNLSLMSSLQEDLELVDRVLRVETFNSSSSIDSEDDDILISPYSEFFHDPDLLRKKTKSQISDIDHLLSLEKNYTQLLVYLSPDFNESIDYKKVFQNFKNIEKKYETQNIQIDLVGSLASSQAFSDVANEDSAVLIPMTAILITIFLLLIFKNFYALILPVILAILSIILTFCMMSFVGIQYNNMISAVPGILLAICLADSIHIISSFYLEKKTKPSLEALRSALEINFLPTLLTSISTIISFLSISNTDIIPIKDLGHLVSFGTFLAWILTYILIGSLLALCHEKIPVREAFYVKFLDKFSFDSKNYIDKIDKYKGRIVLFFAVLFSTSILVSTTLIVDSDPIQYFDEDLPLRVSADHIASKLGFKRAVELIVDSGEVDGAKGVEFLKKQEVLVNWVRNLPEVKSVKSLNSIVKRMNSVIDQKSAIPTKQKTVSELLFLFELSAPSESGLQVFLDNLKRYSRVQIFWNVTNVSESTISMNKILKKAEELDLKVYPGGEFPIFLNIVKNIVSTLLSSMLTALVLVFFLILLVFRNLKISLLAMLPNLIPLCFAGLLVKVSGLFLDIGTSMIATITLGIAIDDTIHFVAKYQEAMKKFDDVKKSLVYTIDNCAGALVQTTIVLFFGFGIFYFASFLPNRNFGVLTSVCIIMALVTDLILLPAILLYGSKKGKR